MDQIEFFVTLVIGLPTALAITEGYKLLLTKAARKSILVQARYAFSFIGAFCLAIIVAGAAIKPLTNTVTALSEWCCSTFQG